MRELLFSHQQTLGAEQVRHHAASAGVADPQWQQCLADSTIDERIKAQRTIADALGVQATPTFFVGTFDAEGAVRVRLRITGSRPLSVFKDAIEIVSRH